MNPNPLPRFSMKDFDGCIPLTPTLINKTELIYLGTSTWDFGGGDVFEQNDSIFTKELITARGYDVTLTVKTPFGCVDSWTNPEKIWVRPFPVADFRYNPDPVSVANDVINFRDESTGAETYDWTMYKDRMGDIVDNTYPDINPKHPTPQEEGEYLVTMDIKSMYGCEDKIQKIITVLGEMLVNVPNSFTPNGDGVNDYFEPVIYGALPGDFSFIVFNRWGEIVFESNKIEHKAWDGFYKGKLLTDGQYVYKLIIKNKYTEKIQEFKGAFRLLN
ncbi:MAG: gliding motility-associated-like protein [Flavobacteriales bacterium]